MRAPWSAEVRRRRAKDRPAGPETQARATEPVRTFAPARGGGACDGRAVRAQVSEDMRRQVGPAGRDDVR